MIEYAQFEVTNFCNLECSFCNRAEVVKNPQHMKLEKWELVLEKLKGQPLREAKLQGLGEPFMHPQYSELCKALKKAFPETFLVTATNGQYRITDNFHNALTYIDEMYISIDGYGDNYERDRAPAKWSKMLEFLKEISTIDRKGCNIVVNYVVTPANVDDIQKVMDLAHANNIAQVWLNIAQNWSEDGLAQNEFTPEQMETLRKYSANVKGRSPWTYSDCFWPIRGLYVDAAGDVKLCCLNTSAVAVGNLFTQSIEEIHSSQRFLDIRQGCLDDDPHEHCKTCSYYELAPILGEIFPDKRTFTPQAPVIRKAKKIAV